MKKKIQGEGIAIFKLIAYARNNKEADRLIDKYFKNDEKTKERYRIYKKEHMMLWGTEYDEA